MSQYPYIEGEISQYPYIWENYYARQLLRKRRELQSNIDAREKYEKFCAAHQIYKTEGINAAYRFYGGKRRDLKHRIRRFEIRNARAS